MSPSAVLGLTLAACAVVAWSLVGIMLQRWRRKGYIAWLPLAVALGMLGTRVAIELREYSLAVAFGHWSIGVLAFGGVVACGRVIVDHRRRHRDGPRYP